MDVRTVIASYAAVVSTGTFGWHLYEFRHARRQHVEVNVKLGLLGMSDGTAPKAILINVYNHGDHPIRVESAGLRLQDGSGGTMIQPYPMPGATVPGTIAPRDSGMTYFLADGVQAPRGRFVLTEPIQSFANLASGETVVSKPARLLRSK